MQQHFLRAPVWNGVEAKLDPKDSAAPSYWFIHKRGNISAEWHLNKIIRKCESN